MTKKKTKKKTNQQIQRTPKMKWCIPKRRDESLLPREAASADFNGPLPENDGNVCIADEAEADEDIREGRVKTFGSPDDLIKSLKKPW
jgi:hypothetical protein